MRNGLIALILQLLACHPRSSSDDLVKTMVAEHKTNWGISDIDYRWENFNYYNQSLCNCVAKIDSKKIKKANSYVIKFINRKDVLLEIIEFNDMEFAKRVYDEAASYAKKIRTTQRKNYGTLCQPIREWDFHFTHINNKTIYLIGRIDGGIVFNNGDESLESDRMVLYEASEVYEYLKKYSK